VHLTAVAIEGECRIIEAHDRALARVGADGRQLRSHMACDVHDGVHTAERRPDLVEPKDRGGRWSACPQGARRESVLGTVVRVLLSGMRNVEEIGWPRREQRLELADSAVGDPNCTIRESPEHYALNAQDLRGRCRLGFAEVGGLRRFAVGHILLARREEHHLDFGAVQDVGPNCSAAADRLIVGMGA
jgi:hypothetical protein